MTDLTETVVAVLPACDVCVRAARAAAPARFLDQPIATAAYDGKTRQGPWAYMCGPHFHDLGVGLGTGRGQRLVLMRGNS